MACAQGFAKVLSEELEALGFPAEVIDMKDYDPDDRLADEVSQNQNQQTLSRLSETRKLLDC